MVSYLIRQYVLELLVELVVVLLLGLELGLELLDEVILLRLGLARLPSSFLLDVGLHVFQGLLLEMDSPLLRSCTTLVGLLEAGLQSDDLPLLSLNDGVTGIYGVFLSSMGPRNWHLLLMESF